MKKIVSVFTLFFVLVMTATGCSAAPAENTKTEKSEAQKIMMQIGNPMMTVDGVDKEIDEGRQTTPIIRDDRTLLPIRAAAEAMGASVAWEEETQTTVLAKGDTIILLTIGSLVAYLNEEKQTLDTQPIILNDRTMLPVRFIAENFGYDVEWNGAAQIITITKINAAQDDTTTDKATDTGKEETMRKSIVVYFSRTGTTKPLAENIAKITNSDIYEIKAAQPYTDDDINYNNSSSRANREQNDMGARPEIAGDPIDVSQYDTVYLGYPIWWGTIPRIINTFIDTYDLSGKTIMPFCTSGGSGISASVSDIKKYCPNSEVKDGLRGTSHTSETEIKQWIEKQHGRKPVFNFETKTVMLSSGYEMPINGLGTYSLHGETCVNAVKSALASGVRLIDTASAYGNEQEVGQAIREAMAEYGIKREEIFVTTKIYPGSEMENPEQSIQACLDRLNIGYVDMMLLHHPDRNDVKAYKVMEQFVKDGKIRSIGLSNWYVKELGEFLPQVDITPALVQNEIHPYYQENDVIPYIQNLGIVVQGWYPLGGRGHTAELLGDAVISGIAKAHGVSSAQVILRWNLQKGVVVIPGSSNPDHIKENTELYHFELTDEEMEKINALDRNEKHDWY